MTFPFGSETVAFLDAQPFGVFYDGSALAERGAYRETRHEVGNLPRVDALCAEYSAPDGYLVVTKLYFRAEFTEQFNSRPDALH